MTPMRYFPLAALAFATVLCPLTHAQTPAQSKPSNATGQCKDGTYSTASSKSGACRGHNGVKDWYTATAATPSAPAAAAKTAAPASPASTPAPAQAAVPAKPAPSAAPAKGPKANLASTQAAAGGAPNLVWVNTSSNVYHCPGTDFYGKTKAGSYMTEADAKGKGSRPDHGKACGK